LRLFYPRIGQDAIGNPYRIGVSFGLPIGANTSGWRPSGTGVQADRHRLGRWLPVGDKIRMKDEILHSVQNDTGESMGVKHQVCAWRNFNPMDLSASSADLCISAVRLFSNHQPPTTNHQPPTTRPYSAIRNLQSAIARLLVIYCTALDVQARSRPCTATSWRKEYGVGKAGDTDPRSATPCA
jgi:hypothetical protein